MAPLPAGPVAVRAAELLAPPLGASLSAHSSMVAASWVQHPGRVMVPQLSVLV
jgi:hypothetical protein